MSWTIFITLIIAWLMCLVMGWTLGGFVHLLPVAAVLVALIYAVRDRRVLR